MSSHPSSGPSPDRVLAILSAAYFFVGTTSLSIAGLLPEMSADLGIAPESIAGLITIFALVYAVAAPGLPALVGHLPHRLLIATGLGTVVLATGAASMAPGYGMLAICVAVMALGAASVGPTASATGAALVAPDRRARALAIVFSGLTVASVFGMPLSSFLGQTFGWRTAWGVISVLAGVVFVMVLFIVPRTSRGQRATLWAYGQVLGDHALMLAIATTGLQLMAQFTTYAFITLWLIETAGTPRAMVPLMLFLFGLGGVAGNLVGPRIVARLGVERTVLSCLCTVSAVLIVLWLFEPQYPWMLGPMLLWSAAGLMVMAPLQSRLVRLAPDRAGLSLAMNASSIYVGMSLGSALSAAVFTAHGTAALPGVSALVILVAAASFALSWRAAP